MNDHHDTALCKRLAERVMGWHIVEQGEDKLEHWADDKGLTWVADLWNPCCHPGHSWMIEERMYALGWFHTWHSATLSAIFSKGYVVSMVEAKGVNRLHATALAADAAMVDQCAHRWVDVTNSMVSQTVVCADCKEIAAMEPDMKLWTEEELGGKVRL